jgi:hypothetical protein
MTIKEGREHFTGPHLKNPEIGKKNNNLILVSNLVSKVLY